MTPHPAILAEINNGMAAARAAHPDLIPHDAESMAAATLQITPTTTTKEETDLDRHPIPKQGPDVDDATLVAMAKAARKTVDQMRNAGPLSQWLALGFIVSLSPAGLRKHGITMPQSARDYWANLATTTEETTMTTTVEEAKMKLSAAREELNDAIVREKIEAARKKVQVDGLSGLLDEATSAVEDGVSYMRMEPAVAKVIFEMAEAYRVAEMMPRIQNVMVPRADAIIESEDDDEVDAVLAEDAARMLRKHRQDMMRDIIGNKSYESLDSQVKHLRNITEIIDQLGRIY